MQQLFFSRLLCTALFVPLPRNFFSIYFCLFVARGLASKKTCCDGRVNTLDHSFDDLEKAYFSEITTNKVNVAEIMGALNDGKTKLTNKYL